MRLTKDQLNDIVAKRGYAISGGVPDKANHPLIPPLMESHSRPRALGKGKAKKGNPRKFLIRVKNFRRRLLDEDNLCEKYHVDCLRYAGLLPSDAPGQAKIEVSQEKVGSKEPERIEIEIDIIHG